jgi:hypothetical protein
MAVINIFFSVVNITDKVIVIAAKAATPLTEEARVVFDPPHPAQINAILPESGEIDAGVYYVYFYSSSDGTSLDFQLARFEVNTKNKKPISEVRFYQTGGPRDVDPAADQSDIIDPYLDGKDITLVNKEGYGPLAPPSTTFKQYSLIAGGGIHLENGQTFNDGEIMSVTITYTHEFEDSASTSGLYNGTVLVDTTRTLDSSYRGKRLKCEGSASMLEVTLEDISNVPDGKFYYFTTNGGVQKQIRILPFDYGTTKIRFESTDYNEISIGRGEFVRVEKYGTYWEVTLFHANLSRVGERINKTLKAVPSGSVEDGALFSGDLWPRIWYWINNFLPAASYIVDDTLDDVGYVRPAGSQGKFIIHSNPNLKLFRVPDTQGMVLKGVSNFNTVAAGPFESGAVGQHYHNQFYDNGTTNNKNPLTEENTPDNRQGLGTDFGNENYEYSITGDAGEATLGRTSLGKTPAGVALGTKNTVDNVGEIWIRLF